MSWPSAAADAALDLPVDGPTYVGGDASAASEDGRPSLRTPGGTCWRSRHPDRCAAAVGNTLTGWWCGAAAGADRPDHAVWSGSPAARRSDCRRGSRPGQVANRSLLSWLLCAAEPYSVRHRLSEPGAAMALLDRHAVGTTQVARAWTTAYRRGLLWRTRCCQRTGPLGWSTCALGPLFAPPCCRSGRATCVIDSEPAGLAGRELLGQQQPPKPLIATATPC